MKKCCIVVFLNNDINLYGYYLLLDIYFDIGNNV